jgi:hypothetical protein
VTDAAGETVPAGSLEDQVGGLVADADPSVAAIAQRVRALVRAVLPGAIEMVDRPARLIGYGRDRGYKGLICGIALQSSWVNLMFSKGTELPDPDRLLEGTGKRARHVKLRSIADVDRPGVRALIVEAGRATP